MNISVEENKKINKITCPCGLPYEAVFEGHMLDNHGRCTAFRHDKSVDKNGKRTLCGRRLADHPREQQLQTFGGNKIYFSLLFYEI